MNTQKYLKTVLVILIAAPVLFASDPAYYTKKHSWEETIWTSINAMREMQQSSETPLGMPDFGSSDFSIMVWMKTSADRSAIYAKVANNAERPELQGKVFYVEDGILKYQIETFGTFDSEFPINDGEWHHVVLTGKAPHEIYVDGEKIKEFNFPEAEKLKPDGTDLRVRLGYGQWRFPFRRIVTFDGVMDEFKIYSRKLSSEEIAGAYNDVHVSSGLAGWWKFEEFVEIDEEEKLLDETPFENHGESFRCELAEGKMGNGLLFTGRSGVSMPRSAGLTAQNNLWGLLARDFTAAREIAEMEREKNDGIWNSASGSNMIQKLAESYAAHTVEFSDLKERALDLAGAAVTQSDLAEIRQLYHLSISNQELYSELMSKIGSMEAAVSHLAEKFGDKYPKGTKYLEQIEDFKNKAYDMVNNTSNSDYADQLGEKFTEFQYEALISSNPLFSFDKLLFTKRFTYNSSHYYTDFIDGVENPGGNLSILNLKDGSVTDLKPEMDKGIFGRYDLSFDADKIVFDWKETEEKGFRIFEMGIDGKGMKQLTFEPEDEAERIERYTSRVYNHHTDDMHPCYLPDGGIVFSSTRCEFSVLCDGPTKLTTAVLYRMEGDGSDMHKLTNSAVSEFSPAVMNDGRIIYSRWEYVDKGQIAVKCLWAMHPDGSSTQEIYGNDIPYPPVFIHPRPIPETNNEFVFLGTPHYPQSGVGTVIKIDINKPIRTHEPMTYITPHVDIRTEGGFHHMVDGKWIRTDDGPLYMDPYPLSDKFFLVAHNPDKRWNDLSAYGLYLIDEFGNHVKIYQDDVYSSWQPMPLTPRDMPPVIPTVRHEIASDDMTQAAEEATVIMSDVYEGLDGIERGEVKYLRIMEQVPRPWSSRRMWEYDGGAPAISTGSVLGLKVMHGVVPVHDDGSASFIVPANKNIYFSALDENYMELQRQRTYINYMPGEKRTCIGCHELRQFSPANKYVEALKYEPVRPHAQPGETAPRAIHYIADVQPVLDKHCISCHNESDDAGGLVLTGELTDMFNVSYENIMAMGLVETVDEGDDFKDTEPLPAKALGSHGSKFILTLYNGHYDVDLPIEDFVKLTTWVDANAQYYGTYYGRQDIRYKDHPDFRPLHSFEEAIGPEPPFDEQLHK
jgi:hypothetical protein